MKLNLFHTSPTHLISILLNNLVSIAVVGRICIWIVAWESTSVKINATFTKSCFNAGGCGRMKKKVYLKLITLAQCSPCHVQRLQVCCPPTCSGLLS